MVRQCYDIQTRVTAQFHGFLSGIAAVAVAAVQVQIRLIPGGRFRFHGDADGNLRLLLHGGYGQRDAPPARFDGRRLKALPPGKQTPR